MEPLKPETAAAGFPAGSGELLAVLDRLLAEHHGRLLQDVECLLQAGLTSPRTSTPTEEAAEEGGAVVALPNSFKVRQSYGEDVVAKRASALAHAPSTPLDLARRGKASLQRRLSQCVNSAGFELASCWLVLANAIFFGMEAQMRATLPPDEQREQRFWLCGQAFTALVTLEILLRIALDPVGFVCSPGKRLWNAFDCFIVVAGALELCLSSMGMETMASLSHVRIVRVARTVKVLRVVRLLSIFASLRILVNSVLNTLRSLVWTMVLLLVVLYLFGLLFTNATLDFLRDSGTAAPELQRLFGSLFRSVYTLFQTVSNGVSWREVAGPLGEVHPAWEVLFSLFIMFIYFAVLNVVTGVFCQSAIESANQDKDTLVQAQMAMKRIYTEQLQLIFSQIDEENAGFITLQVFEEALRDDQVKAYLESLDLTTDDAWSLFRLLDENESNSIDLAEFVEGCLRLRGRARSIDIQLLMAQSKWTMKRLGDVLERIEEPRLTAPCLLAAGRSPGASEALKARGPHKVLSRTSL